MITARPLFLAFSSVSHTLLLIHQKRNKAFNIGYFTSAQRKCLSLFVSIPAYLSQGLNGTGVKRTRQPLANLTAKVNLSGLRLHFPCLFSCRLFYVVCIS